MASTSGNALKSVPLALRILTISIFFFFLHFQISSSGKLITCSKIPASLELLCFHLLEKPGCRALHLDWKNAREHVSHGGQFSSLILGGEGWGGCSNNGKKNVSCPADFTWSSASGPWRMYMHSAEGLHLYRGEQVTLSRKGNDSGGAAETLEVNPVLMYDNQGMLLKGIT